MLLDTMEQIPALPGSYAIQYSLAQNTKIHIGRLGEALLPAGEYVYLGSARGPGGLRARLGRHLGPAPVKSHWHIDSLHAIAHPIAYCYLRDSDKAKGFSIQVIECRWSLVLRSCPGAIIPVHGFGASDCRSGCQAHLIAFPHRAQPPTPFLADPHMKEILANGVKLSQDSIVFVCTSWVAPLDPHA